MKYTDDAFYEADVARLFVRANPGISISANELCDVLHESPKLLALVERALGFTDIGDDD